MSSNVSFPHIPLLSLQHAKKDCASVHERIHYNPAHLQVNLTPIVYGVLELNSIYSHIQHPNIVHFSLKNSTNTPKSMTRIVFIRKRPIIKLHLTSCTYIFSAVKYITIIIILLSCFFRAFICSHILLFISSIFILTILD